MRKLIKPHSTMDRKAIQAYHDETFQVDPSNACLSCHDPSKTHQHWSASGGIGLSTPGAGAQLTVGPDSSLTLGASGGFGLGGNLSLTNDPNPGPHLSVSSSQAVLDSLAAQAQANSGTQEARQDNTRPR